MPRKLANLLSADKYRSFVANQRYCVRLFRGVRVVVVVGKKRIQLARGGGYHEQPSNQSPQC